MKRTRGLVGITLALGACSTPTSTTTTAPPPPPGKATGSATATATADSGSGSTADDTTRAAEQARATAAMAEVPLTPGGEGFGNAGRGFGSGGGRGIGGGRGAGAPTVKLTPPTVGTDGREPIKREIKRNLGQISACYERALVGAPSLAGKVEATFFIGADGKVATSTASGLRDDVARCVAEVIKTIPFPRPNNGAGMQVTYPFTFAPTGG